jgi:hypothetical protein
MLWFLVLSTDSVFVAENAISIWQVLVQHKGLCICTLPVPNGQLALIQLGNPNFVEHTSRTNKNNIQHAQNNVHNMQDTTFFHPSIVLLQWSCITETKHLGGCLCTICKQEQKFAESDGIHPELLCICRAEMIISPICVVG